MVDKIKNLINELNYHTLLYDKGEPVITDHEWDIMYFALQQLEKETGIVFNNSPTQSIEYDFVSVLPKVKHNHPMLSLAKTKEYNEVGKFLGKQDYVAMCKMDGLTCSLTYEDGCLVMAETRGNGEEGEVILHNASVIPSIPKHIPVEGRFVVDGEIICTKHDFEAFKNEYANPRNFAAGSIRLQDSKECANRNLTFVAWDVIEGLEEDWRVSEKLTELASFGFTVVPHYNVLYSPTGVADWYIEALTKSLTKDAEIFGYPIDGCVFKFDDVEYGYSLGSTSHHFNNAIAFKFFDEAYVSTLLDIEWSPGRTGVLTPIAIFEPVEIEGSVVERASLHNVSVMYDTLKCEPMPVKGQKVEVYKSNMIIPQISSSSIEGLDKDNYVYLNIPDTCPICGKPTEIKENDGVKILYCTNPNCEAKLINQLDHFCGKKGLDIKGLSKATLEKLVNWGWIEDVEDLFKLKEHRPEWIKKAGFGPKSVDKILDAIEAGKNCELHQFIAALGIPLIGTTASKELVKKFKTWDEFMEGIENKYKFYEIPNFGDEMHLALHRYNYSLANSIAKNYLNFNETVTVSNNNELEGLNFVITGKLTLSKNRDALKDLIESNGGKVVGSVSKNTSYLINNDSESTSSKNVRAKELNVPIITEAEFFEKFIKK